MKDQPLAEIEVGRLRHEASLVGEEIEELLLKKAPSAVLLPFQSLGFCLIEVPSQINLSLLGLNGSLLLLQFSRHFLYSFFVMLVLALRNHHKSLSGLENIFKGGGLSFLDGNFVFPDRQFYFFEMELFHSPVEICLHGRELGLLPSLLLQEAFFTDSQ